MAFREKAVDWGLLDPLDQSASQVQIQMKARFVQQHGQMLRAKQTDEDEVVVILELEMLSQSLESFLLSEVAFSIPIGGQVWNPLYVSLRR